MKIIDIYKKNSLVFSVEFSPPKDKNGKKKIFEIFKALKKFPIKYFSLTCGALGSKERDIIEIGLLLKKKYQLEVLLHLIGRNKPKKDIENFLIKMKKRKLQNILALRGDLKIDKKEKDCYFQGIKYAFEIVRQIKQNQGGYFCVGVAGYPEGHPECPDFEKNLEYLKIKVQCGADFVISQAFLDVEKFLKFRESALKKGIKIPIVAGVFLLNKISDVKFLSQFLKISVPKKLKEKMKTKKDDKEEIKKIFEEFNFSLVEKLIKEEVCGIHFFTMNRLKPTLKIFEKL